MTTEPIDLDAFTGWVPFATLPTADVPTEPGVYVIVRPTDDPPAFLDASPRRPLQGQRPHRARRRSAGAVGARHPHRLHR
ncbi:hypothetical protein O4157_23100 [Gordonia amicalis]|uniref:hypothetical protein n=1 Tax=Gordonia amicalis TaxID=89053 RepID=UPI0022B552AD|nr:hypothetical protein [Gordonia amicalis]MCZ4654286.1 hypothetical protein [Gordonia amicalis]